VRTLAIADSLLRSKAPDRFVAELSGRRLVVLLVASGFAYGAVMGCSTLRPLQILYSGVKVPILLTAASIVCLPNFFVVNTLLGLREDFRAVVRGLVAAPVTMALVLASLAPFTALAYLSSGDYHFAVVFNGVMFLVASIASHVQLGRVYAPLIRSRPRHRVGKAIWLTLYIFVTIQLAWMLRPFIGAPSLEPTFFRDGVWDNAYVVVFRDVWTLLTK
jgi:hypothetical protein